MAKSISELRKMAAEKVTNALLPYSIDNKVQGEILDNILQIIDSIVAQSGSVFNGVITTSSAGPSSSLKGNLAYISSQTAAGTYVYSNFGNLSVTISESEAPATILITRVNAVWSSRVIPLAMNLDHLANKVETEQALAELKQNTSGAINMSNSNIEEFLYYIVDSESNILFYVNSEGETVVPKFSEDTIEKIGVPNLRKSIEDLREVLSDKKYDEEFIYKILDSDENILFAIRYDGTVYIPKFSEDTIERIGVPNLRKSIEDLNGIVVEENDIEFIYKILDSDENILFAIRHDGTVYIPKLNTEDSATKEELQNLFELITTKAGINYVVNQVELLRTFTSQSNNALVSEFNNILGGIQMLSNKLEKIELDSKFRGFFLNSSNLPVSAKIGDFAYVSEESNGTNTFPGKVYSFDGTKWANTNVNASNVSIDVDLFATKKDIEIINNKIGSSNFNPNISVIYIDNQTDFDDIDNTISELINSASLTDKNTVNIFLRNGVYKYKDAISLNSVQSEKKQNKNINIVVSSAIGEKAVVISDGDDYTPNDAIGFTATHYICERKSDYTFGESYVNQNFKRIETCDTGFVNFEGINKLTELIHVHISNGSNEFWITNNSAPTDGYTATKLCRFKITDELIFLKNKDADYFKNSILFNQGWFNLYVHKINYSDDSYVYFTAQSNNYSDVYKWSVNSDFSFGGLLPSIYITNIPECVSDNTIYSGVIGNKSVIYIPKNITTLYCCKKDTFFDISDVNIGGIDINNISFCGTRDYGYDTNIKYYNFISTRNCSNVNISNNIFSNCGSRNTLSLKSDHSNYSSSNPSEETNEGINVIIKGNEFKDIAGFPIYSTCENTRIENNKLTNTGLFLKFAGSIECSGKNFYIANNICINQSYAGIRIGDTRKATHNISGIIERNLIYNELNHCLKYMRTTTMDGGGIYIFTHNDNTVCRYNIIHDIKGKHSYRGIFCDDGAYNMTIIGNIIYNIEGYTIDARRVPWTPSSNSIGQPLNVGNTVSNNLLFGNYKFEGCDNILESGTTSYTTNMCVKGSNLIGKRFSHLTPYDSIKNIITSEMDIKDSNAYIQEGILYFTADISTWNLDPFVKNRLYKYIFN